MNHRTFTNWSIDTEQPGLPSFTATTPYCDITCPRPTPRVPATESPTMSTLTGSGSVVVVVARRRGERGSTGARRGRQHAATRPPRR